MGSELFISVDIEASGPVPGRYSMLALGACVAGDTSKAFYVEIKPISDNAVAEAMAIVGKGLADFRDGGRDPARAMSEFSGWVSQVSEGKTPVFVGFNAVFDWAFVNWYFDFCGIQNPFGFGALDIKSFYMGMAGCTWGETRSSRIPARYQGVATKPHHALSDAIEQAEMFEKLARAAGVFG